MNAMRAEGLRGYQDLKTGGQTQAAISAGRVLVKLCSSALSTCHGRDMVPQGPGLEIDPDSNVIRDYLV